MRKSFCSLISFLLFSLLACGAASAHWYVAPTGNDANNGSKRKPLKTIAAALQRVNPGDTVAGGIIRRVCRSDTFRKTRQDDNVEKLSW